MARACSGANTVHYAYSMNWPTVVKGASIVDYVLPEDCNGIKDVSFLDDTLSECRKMLTEYITIIGQQKYLLAPPVEDSRNLLDYMLMHYKTWFEAFFKSANMKDWKAQVMLTEMPQYSILSRANSTFYFTFSYDPEITFTPGST